MEERFNTEQEAAHPLLSTDAVLRLMRFLNHSDLNRLHKTCKAFRSAYKRFKFYFFTRKAISKLRSNEATGKQKCPECWLKQEFCACEELRKLASDVRLPRYKVLLYIHYKEVLHRRSSNSARIIPLTLGTPMYVFGDLESEFGLYEVLKETINLRKEPCLVLFPDSSATTTEEFLKQVSASTTTSSLSKTRPITIIVVDGTWSSAKTINSNIPKSIPRVKLSTSSRENFVNMRKFSIKEKVSTMSAFLTLLQELGEKDEVITPLSEMLELVVKRHYAQTQKPVCEVVYSKTKKQKR